VGRKSESLDWSWIYDLDLINGFFYLQGGLVIIVIVLRDGDYAVVEAKQVSDVR